MSELPANFQAAMVFAWPFSGEGEGKSAFYLFMEKMELGESASLYVLKQLKSKNLSNTNKAV
jgi:hypothetical protein